jgi:Rrf2 family protein
MKISNKGEYGIRAMLCIAMEGAERPVNSREIARRQAIPEPYLRQILALLSKDGLIRSTRGPQGGYVLARSADEIDLRQILVSLEGHTTSVDQILSLPCDIELGTDHCAIREVLLEVKRAVEEILTRATLGDLARRQSEILAGDIEVPKELSGGGLASLSIVDD